MPAIRETVNCLPRTNSRLNRTILVIRSASSSLAYHWVRNMKPPLSYFQVGWVMDYTRNVQTWRFSYGLVQLGG